MATTSTLHSDYLRIQKQIHQIIREKGSDSDEFWQKYEELKQVMIKLHGREPKKPC
jgi:hypothetical protein